MQSRCESAEIQEELAEATAQRLKEKLITEMQAADEGNKLQKLEKTRDKELENVRGLQCRVQRAEARRSGNSATQAAGPAGCAESMVRR